MRGKLALKWAVFSTNEKFKGSDRLCKTIFTLNLKNELFRKIIFGKNRSLGSEVNIFSKNDWKKRIGNNGYV